MSNHSIIEHRANYHFIRVEEDYVHICAGGKQYPQCKAIILGILENWTNDKRAKGQEPVVFMTYPEWIDAMYGLFRRSTIIACISELVSEGLITRQPYKRHGKDTYVYTLCTQVVQAKIKALPERIEKYTRPNLNASKFKRIQKQMDAEDDTRPNLNASSHLNLNASEHRHPFKNRRNIDSITQNPDDIDSVNDAASADITDTPVIHPLYPFLSLDDLEHPAVMTIVFEDDDRAELTNEGYGRIAQEVVADLEAKGVTVQVRTEHRKRIAVIDTTHTEVSHVDGLSGEDIRGCTGDHHHSPTHGSSLHALGEMGGQTTPGTTTQVQAQETPVSDSYSHATPEDPLPSVSFLEANTARETGKQENVGAADENDTHSQCEEVEYVPEWAQGATNDTGDSLADAVLVAGDGATGHDRRPVVGDIHAVGEARRAGSESQSGVGTGNSALREQDTGNRQVGTASRSAGERGGRQGGRADSAGPVAPDVRAAGGGETNRGRRGKKEQLTPEELERWRYWKKTINDNRGGNLSEQGVLVDEYNKLVRFIRRFTPVQQDKIWTYMTTKHYKWSKPDFVHTIGGNELEKTADSIKMTLKDLNKWPEDGVPGTPLAPGTWETSPPVVRSPAAPSVGVSGRPNMHTRMQEEYRMYVLGER